MSTAKEFQEKSLQFTGQKTHRHSSFMAGLIDAAKSAGAVDVGDEWDDFKFQDGSILRIGFGSAIALTKSGKLPHGCDPSWRK